MINWSQESSASAGDAVLCRASSDYQAAYQDPFSVEAGKTFHIERRAETWNGNPVWRWVWCMDQRRKSGWVPLDHGTWLPA